MDIVFFTASFWLFPITSSASLGSKRKEQIPILSKTRANHERGINNANIKKFGNYSTNRTSATRITLCLTSCLFSLCFLETIPSSWLAILHKTDNGSDDHGSSFSGKIFGIAHFYKCFLWIYCVWIGLVIPIVISNTILKHIQVLYDSNTTKPTSQRKIFPTLIITVVKSIGLFTSNAVYHLIDAIHVLLLYYFGKSGRNRSNKGSNRGKIETNHFSLHKESQRQPSSAKNKHTIFIFGTLIGILSSFAFFNFFGWRHITALFMISKEDHHHHPFLHYFLLPFSLEFLTSRISNVGVLLSTLLNGFGSVSLPYSFYMAIHMKNILTPESLHKKEADLLRTRCFLEEKKEKLKSSLAVGNKTLIILSGSSLSSMSSTSLPSSSSRSKKMNFFQSRSFCRRESGSYHQNAPHDKETIALADEINRLESICKEQADDISEIKEMMDASNISILGMHSLGKFLGALFTIILWIRVSNSIRVCFTMNANSLIENNDHSDAATLKAPARWDIVSTILNFLIEREIMVKEHYDIFSQCFSFILTVYLSISQITTFSRMLSSIKKRWQSFVSFFCPEKNDILSEHFNNTSSPHKTSSNMDTHSQNSVVNEIADLLTNLMMGSYFLSCIVIMKITIPLKYGVDFWESMGVAQARLNTNMTNKVFLISVFTSGIVLGFTIQTQKDTYRKQSLHKNVDKTISSMVLDSLLYFGSGV